MVDFYLSTFIKIQCNICKETLNRGDFLTHVESCCLQPTSEASSYSNTSENHIENYLSNLYQRVHASENDLNELNNVIVICLLAVLTITVVLVLNTVISYIIHFLIEVFYMIILPSIVQAV